MSDYSRDYLDFYQAYPKSTGKATGFKSWVKLTAAQKAAAQADVEKRVRMGGFHDDPRYIAAPSVYINQRRWEDDWQADLQKSQKAQAKENKGGHVYVPRESNMPDLPDMSREESMLNKLWFCFVRMLRGIPDDKVQPSIALKKDVLRIDMPAALEEYGDNVNAALKAVGMAFCSRMDILLQTSMAERVWARTVTEERGKLGWKK